VTDVYSVMAAGEDEPSSTRLDGEADADDDTDVELDADAVEAVEAAGFVEVHEAVATVSRHPSAICTAPPGLPTQRPRITRGSGVRR
jgi:hypothetical protein